MNQNIITQLIAHGHSKESIKDLSHEQLQEMFDNETKQRIHSFEQILQQEGIVSHDDNIPKTAMRLTPMKTYWDRITSNKDDASVVYAVLDEMVREYARTDIVDFFAHVSSGSLFKSLEGMLELKWCEYQEVLLDTIEAFYKDLPEEELKEQMEHYVRIRSNVPRLEFVIRNLRRHSKDLIAMANLKDLITQEFRKEGTAESDET